MGEKGSNKKHCIKWKGKKICAFGLTVHVIKAQQACYIIYFLITFICSLPKVSNTGTYYEFEEKGGNMGDSVFCIKNKNNNC